MAASSSTPASSSSSDVIAINVLLEPDATMNAAAIAANERLRTGDPAGFALDAEHVPHLTLVQRYVRRASLDAVGAAVTQISRETDPSALELEATGLQASPWEGAAMVSIGVAPVAPLRALQERLVGALAPFTVAAGDESAFVPATSGQAIGDRTVAYVRDFVPQASGANFKPHVTVGLATPAVAATLTAGPFTPFRFHAVLAVYQVGEHGTARRRLWPES